MTPRFKKFLSYYKPYKRLLAADLFFAFLVAATALLFPLGTRYVTKTLVEGNTPDALTQIYLMGAAMVGLVIVHAISDAFVSYQGHMMGALMEGDMRNELLEHYQKLSFGFYDEQKTGQLMSRITTDSFAMSELYHHGPEDIFISLVQFIGAFVILFYVNVPLTLLLLLFLPFIAVYAFYFNGRLNHTLSISRARMGDINAQVEDTLGGIRVVKSFTNEALEQQKFTHENSRFVESRRDVYRSETYFYVGMIVATQLLMIVVVIFGAVSILNGTLDLADMLTYLLCIAILMDPIKRWVNFARLYQEGITGFNRFMEILEIEPDIQDAAGAVEATNVKGAIAFRNVSFTYKSAYGDVLKNISLDIRAGEYVALVGYSGVGKTTLCALIPRFYEVTDGEILLDGTPIRDVTLRSLRRHIGIVQQDVYLFAGTVAENIRYGKPNATNEELIAAAKQANAHDFIMALPNGYDSDIGQRGVKLSGGQKQRLSIARVFLKNPPIIIFDEATSSLDNESEKAVQASLETLASNRTTLVIAHRLSTIRNAERIVVLGENGIEEQGTHDVLIAKNGVYAGLYNMQLMV